MKTISYAIRMHLGRFSSRDSCYLLFRHCLQLNIQRVRYLYDSCLSLWQTDLSCSLNGRRRWCNGHQQEMSTWAGWAAPVDPMVCDHNLRRCFPLRWNLSGYAFPQCVEAVPQTYFCCVVSVLGRPVLCAPLATRCRSALMNNLIKAQMKRYGRISPLKLHNDMKIKT